jgi:dienelactone hydrolase
MKRALIVLFALILGTGAAGAAVKTESVTYKHGDKTFHGYFAWDDASQAKRPGILVVHEWWGLNDYARKRAEQLAGLGYVAFACDMYGEGKTTEHPKEAGAMATEVRTNQKEWRERGLTALGQLRKHPLVDDKKLAAIGYCFGGSTALQLAYSGADLDAVVSFHGGLSVPTEAEAKAIKAKVLICHGAEDSFIPEKTIHDLKAALDKAKVDYKFIAYPNAKHSFTVPEAAKAGVPGIAYNEAADKQSWQDMKEFLARAFGSSK